MATAGYPAPLVGRVKALVGLQADAEWIPLLLALGELERVVQADATVWYMFIKARKCRRSPGQGPHFHLEASLLYRIEGDHKQLAVPAPLQEHVMRLAQLAHRVHLCLYSPEVLLAGNSGTCIIIAPPALNAISYNPSAPRVDGHNR